MAIRAFVTGGSGFLGRNLIAALRARGDEVRALARSESAAETVKKLGAEPVMGDLDNEKAMQAGMQGCDVVFHVAAITNDWGEYDEFYRVNVEGTEHVLAAARAAGVPRLVHVSTEAVLAGGPPIINADETWPLPQHPLGLYPLTKGMAEKRALAANSPELATVVVRPRFIWGKGDTSVLPKLVQMAKSGQFKWIDGGHFPYSTCHVANVCEGLLLAAEKGQGGQVYFLTDGTPVDFRKFMTQVFKTQGIDAGNGSMPIGLARVLARASEFAWRTFKLKGSPPITRTAIELMKVTVNDAKARRELGYQGKMTPMQGLAEMQQG